MRDFRRFHVWHESIELACRVYDATRLLPKSERYGLCAQMRAAAVSVSSNLAEGAGRGSRPELARFLRIAIGSTCELDSQVELAIRLGMMRGAEDLPRDIDRLRRRLIRLLDKVAPGTGGVGR